MQRTESISSSHSVGLRRRRTLVSSLMTSLTAACAILTVALLILILGYIGVRGISSLNLQFLIDTPKPVGEGGGIGNAIVGSFLMTGVASLIGLPIGIAGGVYLAEYGNSWIGRTVRFVADTMTGGLRSSSEFLYSPSSFYRWKTVRVSRRHRSCDHHDTHRCPHDRGNDPSRSEHDARGCACSGCARLACNLGHHSAGREDRDRNWCDACDSSYSGETAPLLFTKRQ